MARTRKADILARGRRHTNGIPGRDAKPKPRREDGDWPEYYRRAELRADIHREIRTRAGWSDAPSYIYPNHNKERL